jgi:hypothetical protein
MHGWLVPTSPSTRPRHDGETTAKPWPWPCVHLGIPSLPDGLIIDETNRMPAMANGVFAEIVATARDSGLEGYDRAASP